MLRLALALLVAVGLSPVAICQTGKPAFPLKISENGRYFTDQTGKPFFYHADTGWQIYQRLTTEEAREYLVFRKNQGFTTIQTQVIMNPEGVNPYGHKAFLGDNDFARPDEAYHDQVARILTMADSLGLFIVMSQPWAGCCREAFGGTPEKPIRKNGPAKNRQYGQYLGKKFARFKNLYYLMGGDNDPKDERVELVAMAEGLRETAPAHQLLTYHASPPHSSTDLFQYAPWLGFSMIYTYWREKPNDYNVHDAMPHVYEAAIREYTKTDRMPFVLGESQYEGSTGNDIGLPIHVRRQAYWTMLCGGAGHAYGSEIWNFPKNWRDILRNPGAAQMQHVATLFNGLPWHTLRPDLRHRALVSGYGDWSKPNFATTAVSEDKKLLVSYLPDIRPVMVDFNYLAGNAFSVRWFDPVRGTWSPEAKVEKKEVTRLQCPPNGDDWVLVVKSL